MDKLIKLSAIEKLAASGPMKSEDKPEMQDSEHECVCSCCGAPCETCAEEDSSEYESEDQSEEE
jgi:hypothetical protein